MRLKYIVCKVLLIFKYLIIINIHLIWFCSVHKVLIGISLTCTIPVIQWQLEVRICSIEDERNCTCHCNSGFNYCTCKFFVYLQDSHFILHQRNGAHETGRIKVSSRKSSSQTTRAEICAEGKTDGRRDKEDENASTCKGDSTRDPQAPKKYKFADSQKVSCAFGSQKCSELSWHQV